jgi:zinc protease
VSLNLLSKDLPEGLALLREVLTQPRFQDDKLELQRQQTLQALQQRNDDSSSIEARELENLSYGNQFWAARQPTSGSVNSLKREDLQAFHRRRVKSRRRSPPNSSRPLPGSMWSTRTSPKAVCRYCCPV